MGVTFCLYCNVTLRNYINTRFALGVPTTSVDMQLADVGYLADALFDHDRFTCRLGHI
jgi:hypothetical protein